MSTKRSIKAKEIVSDIRSGMTNQQLMAKYNTSLDKLHNIFKQLLDAHAIERSALEPLISIPYEQFKIEKTRQLHRGYVFVKLPIYDLGNLINKGTVVDISETGLQVSGIPTNVGDTKNLLVQADYFADVYPFVFEAKCKWVSGVADGLLFSGFEITSITEWGLKELKELTSLLALSG